MFMFCILFLTLSPMSPTESCFVNKPFASGFKFSGSVRRVKIMVYLCFFNFFFLKRGGLNSKKKIKIFYTNI